MESTLTSPVLPAYQGTDAAWQDAYAMALGSAKPVLTVEACVARAAVALRLYGVELQPKVAVNLDVMLGLLT